MYQTLNDHRTILFQSASPSNSLCYYQAIKIQLHFALTKRSGPQLLDRFGKMKIWQTLAGFRQTYSITTWYYKTKIKKLQNL